MLDAELLTGLTKGFLASRYDNPKPIPEFHAEMWELACDLEEPRVAVAAPRGHAKAQPVTAGVLTPGGWRQIGDLKVGDTVISGDGAPVKVRRVYQKSRMQFYRVMTSDGKTTLCNPGHLWVVEIPSNQKGRQVLSLDEIWKNWRTERHDPRYGRDFTEHRYRIPAISPVEFPKVDLPIDPYVLGVWLGDGTSACASITTDDPSIFEGFPYPVRKLSAKQRYAVDGLYADLKDCGLIGNKHVPAIYFRAAVEDRLALLRGLMDSDGTCHKSHGQVSFCNTNRLLVDAVVDLVRGLGGIATISEGSARLNGKDCGLYWRVTCRLALCPFSLERKRALWKPHERLYSYIVGIEPDVEAEGCCIRVEGDTYVTDDYLLTHNSTAMTHAYVLAMMLFRVRDFCLLVSDTEGQAVEFLGDIKAELNGNEALRSAFGIKKLLKDTETNVICLFADGAMFRIQAKGSEQKVRGLKWRNKRPNLIVGDDLENDEIVMNPERREKFRRWFMNALIPCGSDDCLVRIVGTVLHLDSMLQRLLEDPTWKSLRYEAEDGEFGNILWPEQFPEARLRRIRDSYAAQGDIEGYYQEYLNRPIGDENTFFRREDFLDEERDKEGNKLLPNLVHFAAADFAISESQKADFTVIMVGGMDPDGFLHIVDCRSGRWDSEEIIEELISVQRRYDPVVFTFETMTIDKALGPFLDREMRRQKVYLNVNKVTPTKSKTARGKSIQGMMKAGLVRWDKEADWYPATESELMTIATSGPRGAHDDRFDAFAYIGLTVDQYYEAQSPEEIEEEEYDLAFEETFEMGANEDTGY